MSNKTFPALLPPQDPDERMALTMAPALDKDRAGLSRNNFYHPVMVATRTRERAEQQRAALVEVVGAELVDQMEAAA